MVVCVERQANVLDPRTKHNNTSSKQRKATHAEFIFI